MAESASLVLWRTAPSADMAAQTDAGMEREDPGLMTCILLLEDVSREGVFVRDENENEHNRISKRARSQSPTPLRR